MDQAGGRGEDQIGRGRADDDQIEIALGIVADGMGGRSGGRKASDQVLLTARQLFERYSPENDDAPSMLKQIVQDPKKVTPLACA